MSALASSPSRRVVVAAAIGVVVVIGLTAVPAVLLHQVTAEERQVWSDIGQAIGGLGTLFSGLAFIGLIATLLLQNRQIAVQNDQIQIALSDQRRTNEVALRQMHMNLIQMAIDDVELERVWPPISPGVPESRTDHYCNLILYLQKVAFDVGTIELAELRGVLSYLMHSDAVFDFWTKSRTARMSIISGDADEEVFQREVDRAYESALAARDPAADG